MLAWFAVFMLALTALALLAMGFVAVFREDSMRSPGCYYSWGVVAAMFVCVLDDAPRWVLVGNFVILLFTAWLWARDIKERA